MTSSGLWTCSNCGRSFHNLNQWHSCLDLDVETHLADKSPHAVSIYRCLVEALENCGEFRVHPQKTRVGFISQMTFGGVKLANKWVDLGLIAAEPIDTPRVRRLELYGPTSWGHTFRIEDQSEIDAELRSWLCEALQRGNRETLDPQAAVSPIAGHLAEVFWTGFRARVADAGTVRLPGYVNDALGLFDVVIARVSGEEYECVLDLDGDGRSFEIPADTGLGAGDEVDVFIKLP